jgi:hypothetical protein
MLVTNLSSLSVAIFGTGFRLPFTLSRFGYANQGSGRIEVPEPVCPGSSEMEFPDYGKPFASQHCRGEFFREGPSHADEGSGISCQFC